MRECVSNDFQRVRAFDAFEWKSRCSHAFVASVRLSHREFDELHKRGNGVEAQERKEPSIECVACGDIIRVLRLCEREESHTFFGKRVG